MAGELFPVFDVPTEGQEEEAAGGAEFAPSPLWDFEAGDFVTDGAHRALYGSGHEAWALWCTKSIMTQRWAHLAYGDNEGIEADEAFAEPDEEAVESSFERTITEALLADPLGRTLAVRDFEFSWEADCLRVSCEAVGKDGTTAAIEAEVARPG